MHALEYWRRRHLYDDPVRQAAPAVQALVSTLLLKSCNSYPAVRRPSTCAWCLGMGTRAMGLDPDAFSVVRVLVLCHHLRRYVQIHRQGRLSHVEFGPLGPVIRFLDASGVGGRTWPHCCYDFTMFGCRDDATASETHGTGCYVSYVMLCPC